MALKPNFRQDDKLARYIAREYRQNNNRAKVPAFMEDHAATRDGLSVNSLEIETENQIAANYAMQFKDDRPVGVSIHTIDQYNTAAAEAGTTVRWIIESEAWQHSSPNGDEESYRHNPKQNNDSHSLVRFTRHFDDHFEFRFAKRMAHKPRFKMI